MNRTLYASILGLGLAATLYAHGQEAKPDPNLCGAGCMTTIPEHHATFYEPEPMDVPAVKQDAGSEIESVGNFSEFRCSNGGRFTGGGIISGQCSGGFTWTCSDKHRVLLTAENGDKHCILFPRTEPQAEFPREHKLWADGKPKGCPGNPRCFHSGAPSCCYEQP